MLYFYLFLVLTGSPIPSALSLQLYVSYRMCSLHGSVSIHLLGGLISLVIYDEKYNL